MKKRLFALFLLLALALAACTPTPAVIDTEAVTEATTPEKPTLATEATEPTEATEATELTEASTEATEATEETTPEALDIDPGTIDGNAYRNESLGFTCTFPTEWYIFNEREILSLNKYLESMADNEAITNALESGQKVIIFSAAGLAAMASVTIGAQKDPMPLADEETLVKLAAPSVKETMENTAGVENVVCDTAEITFCGQKHTVLSVTCESGGMQVYQTMVYLSRGGLLYNIAVGADQEAVIAEILSFFEAID